MKILFNVNTVKELMTPGPIMIDAEAMLDQAAKKMDAMNCGALPVGTDRNLMGVITDRDIVVRCIARGRNPATTPVKDCMTTEAQWCSEDDTLETAAEIMHLHKIGRLLVKNSRGKVTGILSFGNFLRHDADPKEIVNVIKHCSGPVIASS